MITGIYKLYFKDTDKVYIGQALDIHLRHKIHRTSLRNSKSPKKLQKAYDLYGMPNIEVLLECEKYELDKYENEAISIFDSVNNGFNTIDGNTYRSELKGELAGNAKYSNDLIEEVFNYLVDNILTFHEITSITGVKRGTLVDISCGLSHRWLQDKYPEQYLLLEKLKGTNRKVSKNTSIKLGIKYPDILSPEGTVYQVNSLRGFCRQHNLNHGSLGEVLRGHKIQYKGWTIL